VRISGRQKEDHSLERDSGLCVLVMLRAQYWRAAGAATLHILALIGYYCGQLPAKGESQLKMTRFTVLLLIIALAMMSASMVSAAPVPSQAVSADVGRADKTTIAAERDLIQSRLMDYGITGKAAADRVALLTDEEVHAIAGDVNSLQAAGARDSMDTTTMLLIIIVVVLLVTRD